MKPHRCLALVGALIELVQNKREKEMCALEHGSYNVMQEIHVCMAHVVRERPMQDKCSSEMGHQYVYVISDWAVKWLAKYYREQQAKFYAKAGRSFQQAVVIDHTGAIIGMVHLAAKAKQTQEQVFDIMAHIMYDINA
jgi:Mg/Co/Ni transporter MgtE